MRALVPEDLHRTARAMPEVSAAATLGWIARGKAIARKSNGDEARAFLAANRAPLAAQRIFEKAAIGAGSTSDSTLADGVSIARWSDSARTTSAFYHILADGAFVRLPMETRVGMVTSAPSAGVVAEGKSIPVSRVTINNVVVAPQKVGAMLVVSDSLLLAIGAEQSVFPRELLSVISAAVDTAFVDKIDTGLTPITSTAPMPDLRAALLAVSGVAAPRPYWIAAQDVAKFGSTIGTAKTGAPVAAASATGGELAGLPMLVSSGVPAGTLYLVDAAQVAVAAETPTIEVSTQADILMDTAPTGASDVPTAAQMVSMFETNSTALKATAIFGAEKLRSTAVAVVTGISSTTWAST